MNKRNFLKSIAALGGSALLPSSINPLAMYKTASAAVNYSSATVVAPAVMPQVINIFLYGGPSELSGNLTNMNDSVVGAADGIESNSQNSYVTAFGTRILQNDDDGAGNTSGGANGFITKNGFWRGTERTPGQGNVHLDIGGAGGRAMQFMLDNGYMSVYRTLFKELDGTRSHRESLLQSFKGSLDIEGSAGVGTRIAANLFQNRSQYEGTTTLADTTTPIGDIVNDLLLPFVSFEGDTRAYQQDPDFQIPLVFRGLTLDQDFNNAYERLTDPNAITLEALANNRRTAAYDARYVRAANGLILRKDLDDKIGDITAASVSLLPAINNSIDPADAARDAASIGVAVGDPVEYPGGGNRYTERVRAAVTLALANPSSLYITVGGGLGGWDDHNNGIDSYGNRMNDLFEVMKAAMLHIKYADASKNGGAFTTINGTSRSTDNIVVNMCGDFGRRVNLNGNQGWDHGNNQNLFTFGGAGVRQGGAAALGKVVGKTVRVGASGTNDQVTEPAPGSYKAEPMSVAATVYSYFGVQNPEVLTADDELNPAGVPPIDETTPGEPDLF